MSLDGAVGSCLSYICHKQDQLIFRGQQWLWVISRTGLVVCCLPASSECVVEGAEPCLRSLQASLSLSRRSGQVDLSLLLPEGGWIFAARLLSACGGTVLKTFMKLREVARN